MKLIWSGLLALASVNALELPRVHKPLTKRSTEEGKFNISIKLKVQAS